MADPAYEIRNAVQGLTLLRSREYINGDIAPTLDTVVDAILRVSYYPSIENNATARSLLRALAFLLQEVSISGASGVLSGILNELGDAQIAMFEERLNQVTEEYQIRAQEAAAKAAQAVATSLCGAVDTARLSMEATAESATPATTPPRALQLLWMFVPRPVKVSWLARCC